MNNQKIYRRAAPRRAHAARIMGARARKNIRARPGSWVRTHGAGGENYAAARGRQTAQNAAKYGRAGAATGRGRAKICGHGQDQGRTHTARQAEIRGRTDEPMPKNARADGHGRTEIYERANAADKRREGHFLAVKP